MSLLLETSPKHCANKGFQIKRLFNKRFLYGFFIFLSSILFLVFLFWLILHPSKPQFYLNDTAVYELRVSPSHLLNSTIQITLLSKNPNTRVGVYYDQVRAYAVYKGQQITAESVLPPFYQGHQDTNLLSTSLYGTGMPVAPSIGYEVGRDQTAGKLFLTLTLKLDGQLRWKVGTWVSWRYRFDVDCVAVVGFRPVGDPSGGPLSSMQGTQCSTTV